LIEAARHGAIAAVVSPRGIIASADFEHFAPAPPVASSRALGWRDLLVQSYHEPSTLEYVAVPGTEDPFIAVVLRGVRRIRGKDGDGPWRSALISGACVFLRNAGEPAELQWTAESDEPVETVHLHLSSALLRRVAQDATGSGSPTIEMRNAFAIRDPVIEAIAIALRDEVDRQSPDAAIYADAAAQFLAVHLLRRHCSVALEATESAAALDRYASRRVTDYVHAHLDREIRLAELAGIAGLSPYHFARRFKAATGLSPHRFVVRARILAAKDLLRSGRDSVAAVAFAVGFASVSQFTAQFRRWAGTSPARFRQRRR
jgi:AraC family transcriptional regulator